MDTEPAAGGVETQQPKRKRIKPVRAEKIIISGGGIAGLALALALKRRGKSPIVYERDNHFDERRQGYGMTLSTTNMALGQLGILEELRERDTVSASHYVFDATGEIMGYFGGAFSDKPGSGVRGNLRVPRSVLRQMLRDRLDPECIRWGRQVVDFKDDPDASAVEVTLDDGTTETCDVLVGAEGIRSKIRQKKTGDELKYLGVMAVVGITSHQHPLLAHRGFYTLDGVHRLFTMPFADAVGDHPAMTMWQLTFWTPEADAVALSKLPKEALMAKLTQRCKSWHTPVLDMFRETVSGDIWAHPLYDRDPMAQPVKKSKSRVTVVGDAAHPMSPFKGMGANTSLFDGSHLAKCLDTMPAASGVAVYEREMLARSTKTVLASRSAAVSLHSDQALASPATTYGLQGVPSDDTEPVLAELRSKGVTAELDGDLDAAVRNVIKVGAGAKALVTAPQ